MGLCVFVIVSEVELVKYRTTDTFLLLFRLCVSFSFSHSFLSVNLSLSHSPSLNVNFVFCFDEASSFFSPFSMDISHGDEEKIGYVNRPGARGRGGGGRRRQRDRCKRL